MRVPSHEQRQSLRTKSRRTSSWDATTTPSYEPPASYFYVNASGETSSAKQHPHTYTDHRLQPVATPSRRADPCYTSPLQKQHPYEPPPLQPPVTNLNVAKRIHSSIDRTLGLSLAPRLRAVPAANVSFTSEHPTAGQQPSRASPSLHTCPPIAVFLPEPLSDCEWSW